MRSYVATVSMLSQVYGGDSSDTARDEDSEEAPGSEGGSDREDAPDANHHCGGRCGCPGGLCTPPPPFYPNPQFQPVATVPLQPQIQDVHP